MYRIRGTTGDRLPQHPRMAPEKLSDHEARCRHSLLRSDSFAQFYTGRSRQSRCDELAHRVLNEKASPAQHFAAARGPIAPKIENFECRHAPGDRTHRRQVSLDGRMLMRVLQNREVAEREVHRGAADADVLLLFQPGARNGPSKLRISVQHVAAADLRKFAEA